MAILLIKISAVLFVLLLVYGYLSNYLLTTERYEVNEGENRTEELPVRIVMLADLHGSRFGRDNARLICKIKEQSPDMVCIAGDMTVKNGTGSDECLFLCRKLLELCPVYYAPGNHEIRMPQWQSYATELRKTGVTLLDNEQTEVRIRGKQLMICGLNQPEEYYHKFWQRREFGVEQMTTLVGEADRQKYTILLAHNPEYFDTYCSWGANLVCSGHVHGGIARLPILGGVLDPSLRIFPSFDAGRFEKDSGVMILSRGLGTHHIRLRFFNVPEISIIDLHVQ